MIALILSHFCPSVIFERRQITRQVLLALGCQDIVPWLPRELALELLRLHHDMLAALQQRLFNAMVLLLGVLAFLAHSLDCAVVLCCGVENASFLPAARVRLF